MWKNLKEDSWGRYEKSEEKIKDTLDHSIWERLIEGIRENTNIDHIVG